MRMMMAGVAGFVDSHVAMKFLESGQEDIGIDSVSPRYYVTLKKTCVVRSVSELIEQVRYRPQVSVEDSATNFVRRCCQDHHLA